MRFLAETPDFIGIFSEGNFWEREAAETIAEEDVSVTLEQTEDSLRVSLQADTTPIRFLRLRWNMPVPKKALFTGDAWERGYGTFHWGGMEPDRFMRWYFLMHEAGRTCAAGVRTRPAALVLWTVDSAGVTCWLDVRCGCRGVLLKGRRLVVAEVVSRDYAAGTPFQAMRDFCRVMCPAPLMPDHVVYGGNNWYYANGNSSSQEILEDCDYLASLCGGCANRPYMVIDAGWQSNFMETGNHGPWERGNGKFPDMPKLAEDMRGKGVRPGLWIRPLRIARGCVPNEFLLWPDNRREDGVLDPSIPEVQQRIHDDIARLVQWGYQLIKHDFSTFDIFNCWGEHAASWLAWPEWTRENGWNKWHFADASRTSAEVIIRLYKIIHEAAQGAIVLGCNTMGHLGAGLMEMSRIGDDTSGRSWDQTRMMGVNSLAFRYAQHKTFFVADADCLCVTGQIDWALNRQWGELLAESGTAFFASIKPHVLTHDQFLEMRMFYEKGSIGAGEAEPLDWLDTATPEVWRLNGVERSFSWFARKGPDPFFSY